MVPAMSGSNSRADAVVWLHAGESLTSLHAWPRYIAGSRWSFYGLGGARKRAVVLLSPQSAAANDTLTYIRLISKRVGVALRAEGG